MWRWLVAVFLLNVAVTLWAVQFLLGEMIKIYDSLLPWMRIQEELDRALIEGIWGPKEDTETP